MKRLYIVRHAKSSWHDSSLTDFERPLNKRGMRDAPLMANLIKRLHMVPQAIISSPATRAISTATIFAEEFAFDPAQIRQEPTLYETGVQEYIRILSTLDDDVPSAMIVGHNPTITSLAEYVSDLEVANVPTCGIAVVDLAIDRWSDIGDAPGICRAFEYPKKYKLKEQ